MPWKRDANGKWGNFDDPPAEETPPPMEIAEQSLQQSALRSHQNSSMEIAVQSQLQSQQEDLPEKRQAPYEGRWVLDPTGEKMIYVVTELPPVPKFVIPLPPPPSDCGSAFQSDSSLTLSHYTADFRSRTFDEIDQSAHSRIIDSDNEGDDKKENNVQKARKTTNSVGSGRNSNGSTASATADLSNDLEGQGYPQGILNNKNARKKVTLVEPTKNWSDEREEHLQIQEKIRKTKRREICCRKAVYVLIFLSLLAIVIGGGLGALVYFDVIDADNLNLDFLKRNPTSTTELDESNDKNDGLFLTPLATSSPTISPTRNGPTPPPTVSVESTFITDTLSGQFRIYLPRDPEAPPNRAVSWMTKELKAVGRGDFDYKYDNLGKFGQRFSILATQYSLLGDSNQGFSWDEQMGVDECDWEGVDCDAYGRVTGLDFSDLGLTGTIPSEIQYLFKLETLDLSNNGITGDIPKYVYDLRNLRKIYLYQNKLTGTISTLIGQLDSLEYLHLSHNSLSGSIPEQLRSYSYSVVNPLSKSMAVPMARELSPYNLLANILCLYFLHSSVYLNLYDNQLTGTIPKNLNLGNLFYFDIGRNFIGGSIPADIGTDYSRLKYLHVDHNRLTSSIPDTIPLMANGRMISLLANHNQLSGSVPDNWLMFNKLVQFNIQGTL